MKKVIFFFILVLLVVTGNVYADLFSLLQEEKLIDAPEIVSRLGTGRVKVIVNLTKPTVPQPEIGMAPQSYDSVKMQIQSVQVSVLSGLDQTNFQLRHLFENQAGFSCEVDLDTLQQLVDNPDVVSISPVRILESHLKQGLSIIDPEGKRLDYYDREYNGEGVSIAICDTGVDYTHPMLGGKFLGGYDFGEGDGNPFPVGNAHGTCCAGIAAGAMPDQEMGDYVGGVAFNAKIYGIKISPDGQGYAYEDAMIAAWDWCVTHKDDDPENPILVISTSFGGGLYSSDCDSVSPAMTQAAENAVEAGITLVVSSGNEGACEAIAWPSCISSVISVGAVYDVTLEGELYAWFLPDTSCAEPYEDPAYEIPDGYILAIEDVVADTVPLYSNSAEILDIFAPSHNAYTTDIVGSEGYDGSDYTPDFGGTSAACPYAAGVIACLQTASLNLKGYYMPPEDMRDLISDTGDKVTDKKTDPADPNLFSGAKITKPRVNLGAAYDELPHDIFEEDNVNDDTKPVSTAGTLQEHSIIPEGDVDWVEFYIPANSQVIIEITADGNFDSEIWLYDSDDNEWAYDDDGARRGCSKIETILPEGLYKLRIERKTGTFGSPYWYWVSVTADGRKIDILADSFVNFEDFAYLASWWLTDDCDSYEDCNKADLDYSNSIDGDDLEIIADNWLNIGSPDVNFTTIYGDSWLISRQEITNRQYCIYLNAAYPDKVKVVEGIVYEANDVNNTMPLFDTYSYDTYSQITFDGSSFDVRMKDGKVMDNHPVVMVSWYGAKAFCDFYGYWLPTEDQWEQAARDFIPGLDFPWGFSWMDTKGNCWDSSDGYESGPWPWTSPVAHIPEQNYNYINDMAGNVWEWTDSSYDGYYILRGGSWYSYGGDCEIENRIGSDPASRYFHYGFRVCMDRPE